MDIDFDDRDLQRLENGLKVLKNKALPFATKQTVNQAAWSARADSQDNIREEFILRETGVEPSFGYRSLDDQLKEIFIEPNDRDTFKSSLVARNFSEEDLLFEARDIEPKLYFVEKGELTIYVKRAGEPPYRLRRVGPGSLLGIAGFFGTGTRSADIYAQATSDGRAYYLTKDKFSEMSDSHPHIVKALQSFILGVLSERFMSNLNILEILLRAEE